MKLYKERLGNFSDAEYDKYFGMMSEERKASVLRYKSENDRKRTVLGERLARMAVSDAFGLDERDIEFERTENGKPYAKGIDIHFSISHSKDRVVCAVSDAEIGVDVERIRPVSLRVARFACTERDIELIFGGNIPNETEPDAESLLSFFKLWTAKEAYVKCIGTGISELKSFDYADIEPYCRTDIEDGYVITTYKK